MTALLGFSQTAADTKIWFNHPALNWNEALPVGNGRIGAMIFGGIERERLQLNEQSIWSGNRNDFVNPAAAKSLAKIRALLFSGHYKEAERLAQQTMMGDKKIHSSYQMLGDLVLEFPKQNDVHSYRRDLDLGTAVASVSYGVKDIYYRREVFSSAPDEAIVCRLTASKPASISFDLSIARPGNFQNVLYTDSEIEIYHKVQPEGVTFAAKIKLVVEGGAVEKVGTVLRVNDANSVTVVITAATNYFGVDPNIVTRNQQSVAQSKTFDELKARHVSDYQTYFNACRFSLDVPSRSSYPTDARLLALKDGLSDEKLFELYFNFGRYLLISSSRAGGLPANLQGLWADGLNPPWDADYHININIQMNYWPAEVTNLSSLHEPFLNYLTALNTDGKKTAKSMYGLPGSVAHFTSDAWHFTETYGHPQWAMWPMGLAWSVRHFWEHYQYAGDEKFLREKAYPVMKDAATFCASWLVKDPESKKLVSGPSISPENTIKTKQGEVATMVMGPTMDHMIIRDLFSNVIAASLVLKADENFRKQLQGKLALLTPTAIGDDGRIMEWSKIFEEPEPGHRHISHLYGLHPANQITSKDTALMKAARATIDYRLAHGGGHTGWSKAWIINFFARLLDGNAAHQNLTSLLEKSTLPNLFDNHPPFQIDGNFGATAGIAEMLLQSHGDEIVLLPALPTAWPTGSINGVCARGGFELNVSWKDGKLDFVEVLTKLGKRATLRYGSTTYLLDATTPGQQLYLDGMLKPSHK
ncbi:glycoside hydrolase family 95 protein [Pseudochryseolinea flava]|uniref:glycoside hydrolase family 95 protein n=1 Tax=Pseudochryseolinea flava TaxID=2059302 RepID=UPI0014033D06|nr:glycoside hydrolase N-terminal domain-containing protein [Pseudochryseolinea flava]